MRRALVALLALAAACGRGPTYLGAPLPPACSRSLGACEYELALRFYEDRYPAADRALHAYVSRVADRIARVSTLERTPPIAIIPQGSAAVVGSTIVLARDQLVGLGSEAELAAILAHEIVHIESRLAALNRKVRVDDASMRALEGVADERAVLLLERAGYPGSAMYRALVSIGDHPDAGHPPHALRLRRIALLADVHTTGEDGRARFLAAIAGAPVGNDLGARVGDAYVYPRAGLAVTLPASVTPAGDPQTLAGSEHATDRYFLTYALGPRTAAALIARLRGRHTLRVAVGEVVVGRPPAEVALGLPSRERLLESTLRGRWDLEQRSAVAVIVRRSEAVLLVVSGAEPLAAVEAWAKQVRAPSERERDLARSPRIVLVPAPRAGTVGELASACVDPAAAREIDDPARHLAAGDAIKCTDRISATGGVAR